jgi:hypothetical protein
MGTVAPAPLMLPTPTRCGRCGTRVRWIAGRYFNADPDPRGRWVFVLSEDRQSWDAERRRPYRARGLQHVGHELYAEHTCNRGK